MKPLCPVHGCPLRKRSFGLGGWYCPQKGKRACGALEASGDCSASWGSLKPPARLAPAAKQRHKALPEVSRRGWKKKSDTARARELNVCQLCGKVGRSLPVDHVIALRLLTTAEDRADTKNHILICREAHGRKLALDLKLFKGDVLGFLEGIKAMGYPLPAIAWAEDWLRRRR